MKMFFVFVVLLLNSIILGADQDIVIAVAGDSTVQSYKKNDIAGWGQVLGQFFKSNVKIKNYAVGGY